MVSKVGGPPGGGPPGVKDDKEEDSAIYNQLKKFINVIVSKKIVNTCNTSQVLFFPIIHF